MKIIQIASVDQDIIVALTDDGRIFSGYWRGGEFNWWRELTPDYGKLQRVPVISTHKGDDKS